jgi:hypothetical protein
LFDTTCIVMEGARQRGFKIQRLGTGKSEDEGKDGFKWLKDRNERHLKLIKSKFLAHA